MSVTITVYSTPDCVQCGLTKTKLNKLEAPYREVDLSTHPDDLEACKALGYLRAPVVVANINGEEKHWGGFRPDLLTDAANAYHAAHKATA